MDPISAIVGLVVSVASCAWEYEQKSSQADQGKQALEELLQAQQAAFLLIAQQMLASALYELRKAELDTIKANIETVQEILDSTKSAVPPLDAATAGDLSCAENLADLTVHDGNALQNELQSDATAGRQTETTIRQLLVPTIAAEVDAGLLRYACLHRWEVLGVADQSDEQTTTLNDLLTGCDTALSTLRFFDDRRVQYISRRRPLPAGDEAKGQTQRMGGPLWDFGYIDDGLVVWVYVDIYNNDPRKAQYIQDVNGQVASLQQAHFSNDPDVQAVQRLEQTIKEQGNRLTMYKLPGPGSIYPAPNQRRLSAQARFAIAASSPSRAVANSVVPAEKKSQSWMAKPLAEIIANPELLPFLGSELSIDAEKEQPAVDEVTFTLTFTPGIFDTNAPERNITVPVFIMDEFGNRPLVQPEYQLSSKGAKVSATVQVPVQLPERMNPSRDIFIVADPLNSIVECKKDDGWKKVSVSGVKAPVLT